jgi:hypothetical protein
MVHPGEAEMWLPGGRAFEVGEEREETDASADVDLVEEDGDEAAGFIVAAGGSGGSEGVVAGLKVQVEGGVGFEVGGVLEADEAATAAEVDDGAGLVGEAVDYSEGDAAGAGVPGILAAVGYLLLV